MRAALIPIQKILERRWIHLMMSVDSASSQALLKPQPDPDILLTQVWERFGMGLSFSPWKRRVNVSCRYISDLNEEHADDWLAEAVARQDLQVVTTNSFRWTHLCSTAPIRVWDYLQYRRRNSAQPKELLHDRRLSYTQIEESSLPNVGFCSC
jgi:hypothetical protein